MTARPPLPPSDPQQAACDVLVVGGGINGCGIARDLAGRGASVVLAEQDDLAAHTSSASTKLIHGGLRYLEYYEFSLVRKALAEREVLLRSAPHIMWPLRFVMPHDPSMRPAWMIRAGLFLYDHLAKRELLPGSTGLNLRQHPSGAPLKPGFTQGFKYSDGWVDDARLVVLNARSAAQHGAQVLTRCAVAQARRTPDGTAWDVLLQHTGDGSQRLRARAIVNATGPWAAAFLHQQLGSPRARPLRLVKGSHIVVPRCFDHPYAYIFQNPDRRIIFAIPYERDFTLIGTTDVEHHGAIGAAAADADEVHYLCEQASRYFSKPVRPEDVCWTYSGVRPLLDDESGNPAAVTRDYALELSGVDEGAPLLSVWGGKITTFRRLAEDAAQMLVPRLGLNGADWTAHEALPGGDLSLLLENGSGPRAPVGSPEAFDQAVAALQRRHPQVAPALVHRLARAYGSDAAALLQRGLGAEIAPGLHEAELRHLHENEWARSAEDVLWRRSKLGLHYDAAQRAAVAAWCAARWQPLRDEPRAASAAREHAWS